MSDNPAKARFLTLQLVRLSGVAMVIIGLLTTQKALPLPKEAGFVLLITGMVEVFVVPHLLAKRWKSPSE